MLETSANESYDKIQGLSGMNSTQYCDIADRTQQTEINNRIISDIRYGLVSGGLLAAGSKIFIWGVDDE